MGIDWEGILDAEGADMADAYDALVFDAYDSEEAWDEGEEFQDDEGNDEDSAESPSSDSEEMPLPYAEIDYCIDEEISVADDDREIIRKQKRDIQKLIAILIENDIPIPDDIIDKYIKRSPSADSEKRPKDLKSSEIDDGDLPF